MIPKTPTVLKNKKQPAGKTALDIILKTLEDGKAEDVVSASVGDKTSLTDTLVIASGTSVRHVAALADALEKNLKDFGEKPRVDGKNGSGEWIILDTGSVMVHLFYPETRMKYDLEELWGIRKVPA